MAEKRITTTIYPEQGRVVQRQANRESVVTAFTRRDDGSYFTVTLRVSYRGAISLMLDESGGPWDVELYRRDGTPQTTP